MTFLKNEAQSLDIAILENGSSSLLQVQVQRLLLGGRYKNRIYITRTVELWMMAIKHDSVLAWLFASLILCLLSCLSYFSMAREVEEIVRTNGAVPATVGILRGQIHVGLTEEELEFLASSKNAVKVSRRDFPFVLSQVWCTDFLVGSSPVKHSALQLQARWLLNLSKISWKGVFIGKGYLLVSSKVVLKSRVKIQQSKRLTYMK